MLLAGSGNTWSSTNMSRPGSVAPGRPFPAPAAVPQPAPSTPGSPAPPAPTTSATVPPRPMVPGVVFSNVRQAPINNGIIVEPSSLTCAPQLHEWLSFLVGKVREFEVICVGTDCNWLSCDV